MNVPISQIKHQRSVCTNSVCCKQTICRLEFKLQSTWCSATGNYTGPHPNFASNLISCCSVSHSQTQKFGLFYVRIYIIGAAISCKLALLFAFIDRKLHEPSWFVVKEAVPKFLSDRNSVMSSRTAANILIDEPNGITIIDADWLINNCVRWTFADHFSVSYPNISVRYVYQRDSSWFLSNIIFFPFEIDEPFRICLIQFEKLLRFFINNVK